MMTKRASLHTLGCRVNQAETAILGEGLRRKGYRLVEFGEPTDLLVLNTCAVTEDAERTSRYLIRKTLKHSPHAFIAVTGCYAQTGIDELKLHPGVDLIVGHRYKLDLPGYVPASQDLRKYDAPEVHHSKTVARDDFALPYYGESAATRAPLKIQDGCGDMCSFCIIPFSRGHARSRVFDDVIAEAESLAAQGHREVVLTGVNIGRYEQGGKDFCAVLDRLELVPGINRIRISSIEPTTVSDALLDRMAGSRAICPYLHIPLQSGDDRVLADMNRHYAVGDYIALIERALRRIPHVGLGTDVMVGFPGETDDCFENTVRVAAELPFSYLHVFSYSARPGTAATKRPHPVAPATIAHRSAMLQRLSRAKRLQFHQRHIGRTLPVLFEAGETDEACYGTTDTFMKVAVPPAAGLRNQILPVTITAATDRCAMGTIEPVHARSPQTVLL